MTSRYTQCAQLLAALGLLFSGCKTTSTGSLGGTKPRTEEPTPFLAGTFQGTFSIGHTRVRAEKGANDLFVAKLGAPGQAEWLRSFPGLAEGRAVASAPLADLFAVVGVFHGEL